MEIIPVLHNVGSVQRLVDSARISYIMGARVFVATKVYGGAAQSGVAEAMRLALKLDRSFIILSDLEDAIDILSPEEIVLVTSDYARERVNPFSWNPSSNGRILLVVSGSEPEFSPRELKLGKPVYIKGLDRRIGPTGELALLLYRFSSGTPHGDRL